MARVMSSLRRSSGERRMLHSLYSLYRFSASPNSGAQFASYASLRGTATYRWVTKPVITGLPHTVKKTSTLPSFVGSRLQSSSIPVEHHESTHLRKYSHRLAVAITLTISYLIFQGIPIQAQATESFVSNWSQSTNATLLVDDERLQTFTTGTHIAGYSLTRIDLDFVLYASVDKFTVDLWTKVGNRPGNRLATLTTSGVELEGATQFTPRNRVTLTSSTQYFIRIAVTNPDEFLILKATKSDNEDRPDQSTGWRIADGSIDVRELGSTSWLAEPNVLKMRVVGQKIVNDDVPVD